MAGEPKPMDPERLADWREEIGELVEIDRRIRRMHEVGEIAELLAAHDYERARVEQAYTDGRTAERADVVDFIRYPPGSIPETAIGIVADLWRALVEGRHADLDPRALDRLTALRGSSVSAIDWRARAERAEAEARDWASREHDAVNRKVVVEARALRAERERDELHARLVESNKALDGLDRRLVERQRERDEARASANTYKTRCERYEHVMAALPLDCWPEYEGADAVTRLVELASIGRQWREDSSLAKWFPITGERLAEEQAARERAEAEVARLRARVRNCRPDDIERALARGLTAQKVRAWAEANGISIYHHWNGEIDPHTFCVDGWAQLVRRPPLTIIDEMVAMPRRCERTGNPCGTDTWAVGKSCPCPGCQAYLDEMAAMEVSSDG